MVDVRFPTALQLMLQLAHAERRGVERLTSARLAHGLGAAPGLVRGVVVDLARAGLVRSTMGKNGGITIARAPELISLGEIYRAAVGEKKIFVPRPGVPHRCAVSSNMETVFIQLAEAIEASVTDILDARTLARLLDDLLALQASRKPTTAGRRSTAPNRAALRRS